MAEEYCMRQEGCKMRTQLMQAYGNDDFCKRYGRLSEKGICSGLQACEHLKEVTLGEMTAELMKCPYPEA